MRDSERSLDYIRAWNEKGPYEFNSWNEKGPYTPSSYKEDTAKSYKHEIGSKELS